MREYIPDKVTEIDELSDAVQQLQVKKILKKEVVNRETVQEYIAQSSCKPDLPVIKISLAYLSSVLAG